MRAHVLNTTVWRLIVKMAYTNGCDNDPPRPTSRGPNVKVYQHANQGRGQANFAVLQIDRNLPPPATASTPQHTPNATVAATSYHQLFLSGARHPQPSVVTVCPDLAHRA